jgi:U3 small nucleolar RNA-associated protein 13
LEHHNSIITDFCFSDEGRILITSSRDNIINVYENHKLSKTIPVYESIEGIIMSPINKNILITASTNGNLRGWDLIKKECVINKELIKKNNNKENEVEEEKVEDEIKFIKNKSFTQIKSCPISKEIFTITEENNFLIFSPETLKKKRQIIGFNDDVLAIELLGKKQILVATNNENISLIDLDTKDTKFFSGHKDTVLTISSSYLNNNNNNNNNNENNNENKNNENNKKNKKNSTSLTIQNILKSNQIFISGSKDKNIRIWDTLLNKCIAIGDSHSSSVTIIKFSPKRTFFVSGSEDKTLKLWKLDQLENFYNNKKLNNNDNNNDENENENNGDDENILILQCHKTIIAHKKEVSDISISPDESLIATCSSGILLLFKKYFR